MSEPLPERKTNKLAVISYISSIASLILFAFNIAAAAAILALLIIAILCGHISLLQIRKSRGAEKGDKFALSGLVFGYILLGVFTVSWLVSVISTYM